MTNGRGDMSEPDPVKTSEQDPVALQLFLDIAERVRAGKARYSVYLMTENGRRPLHDAYEEVIDLAMYLCQEIMEREKKSPERLVINITGATALREGLQQILHGEPPAMVPGNSLLTVKHLREYIEKLQDIADDLLTVLSDNVSAI